MNLNANDIALAGETLSERYCDQVEGETVQEITDGMHAAGSRAHATIKLLKDLHGIRAPGDALQGDPETVDTILAMMSAAERDPAAYAALLDLDPVEVAPPPAPKPMTSAPALRIVDDTDAPVETTPTLRMVSRPAASLFPKISAKVGQLMMPTATWTGGTPPGIPTRSPSFRFQPRDIRLAAAALQRHKNIAAVGDPGCGKTEFFRQLAAVTNMPFTVVPMDGSLRRADLIGSFQQISSIHGSSTPFILGLLPRAISRPGIVLLDELDQCDPDNQYVMHGIYEGGGLILLEDGGRVISRDPNCYLAMACNTKGRGSENGLTHVRYEMSEATRDRIPIWLDFTYLDATSEAEVLVEEYGIDQSLARIAVGVANKIRDAYRTGACAQPCSMRQLKDVAEIAVELGGATDPTALAIAANAVFAGRANPDDAAAIREFIKLGSGIDLELLN